jgi:hypothetical protein
MLILFQADEHSCDLAPALDEPSLIGQRIQQAGELRRSLGAGDKFVRREQYFGHYNAPFYSDFKLAFYPG